eukprot:11188779-Lingulodinium_polyedra.AAC.1
MRSTPPTGFPKQHVPTLPPMGFRRSRRQASPRPHTHSLGQRSFCAHGQPEIRQHPHEAEGD